MPRSRAIFTGRRGIASPAFLLLSGIAQAADPAFFGIRITDAETGRPVPVMELETVNGQRFHSDNAGWVAFLEPGLMDREVWFHVRGPGYEVKKDGFGYRGVRLRPVAGGTAEIKVERTQPAERIARLTGQGLYRDSALLGRGSPLPNLAAAGITGQDSVQAVPWRGGVFWLWGDTNLPGYPLGHFHTTAALTDAPVNGEQPLAFRYFTAPDDATRPRKMLPHSGPGAVWMFGLLSAPDGGKERLLSHWARHPSLGERAEHGLAEFEEGAGTFKILRTLPPDDAWRHPRGHAVRVRDAEGDWFYFTSPLPHTRVTATAAAVLDPAQYEALRWDGTAWQWQRREPPHTQAEETRMALPPEHRRWQLTAPDGSPVRIHTGSVQWNAWRTRYILTAMQAGGKDDPSAFGEMWYAEAPHPSGPWRTAVKIASHPRYTFYNPIHHGFMDREGGRIIYFEGTYTAEFSGNPQRTPRADYNQILYRLDLSAPALKPAQQP